MTDNVNNHLDQIFSIKMRPSAIRIYSSIWTNCKIESLRMDGVAVHPLDQFYGIDTTANLPGGQFLTIQEKYRRHENLHYRDFTQEYMNQVGYRVTFHPYTKTRLPEKDIQGEWFKLAANYYFYGWANHEETDFKEWFLLDIPKYKLLVESSGGLDKLGTYHANRAAGNATFYAIKINKLIPAIIHHSKTLFLSTIIFLSILLISPASAEPPIHSWTSSSPAPSYISQNTNNSTPVEIHGSVFMTPAKIPPRKTRWQKFKSVSFNAGKVLINLIEVAGSIAQILQYAHR